MSKPRRSRPVPDANWLREQAAARGLSQNALGARLGVDSSAIWRRLAGQGRWSLEDLVALLGVLDVSAETILQRLGYDVPARGAVVVGRVDAEARVHADGPRLGDRVPKCEDPAGTAALIVDAGGSAYDGAVLLYVPRTTLEPDAFGRLAVIECDATALPVVGVLGRSRTRGCVDVTPFLGAPLITARRVRNAAPLAAINLSFFG